jgi:hypothetical protein
LFVEQRNQRYAKARYRQKPQNHHRNQGASFSVILELIEPLMEKQNEQKSMNSSGCAISLRTWLAVTLRWLMGGSQLDICFAFGVANSTFFQ